MAVQTTPNLGLTLPYQSDPVAVSTQNSNMTLIDTAFGALPSGKTVQGQIDELNSNLTAQTGTVTLSSDRVEDGASEHSNANTSLIKCGGIAVLSVLVTTKAELNNWQTGIGVVGTGWRPKVNTPFLCRVINSSIDKVVSGSIYYNDGAINIMHGGVPSGTRFIANITYAIG